MFVVTPLSSKNTRRWGEIWLTCSHHACRRRRPSSLSCSWAMLDKETGALVERRLLHTEEARAFYQELRGPVVVGIEASGNTQWFESLLGRCQHQLWVGD